MTLERIVCGVDGSEAGFEALRQGRRLLAPGGRIVAVTVVEERIAVHAGMLASRVLDDLQAEAEAVRQAAQELLGGLDAAEAIVVAGRPNDALRSVAAREQADLVAVGTHGQSRRVGVLLGSVPTTMLHEAQCSVLIARPANPGTVFPSALVAGIDGSAESAEAAAVAVVLADRFGASLRVLAASGGKQSVDLDAVQAISSVVEIDSRRPLEALKAASRQADLLVLGNRGLHGIRALGSISERAAHRVRCSVLVVHSRGIGHTGTTA
jgi:nucleotide-binding universal stress UspA family protein